MADIYCRSVDGDNANDGSTRALAKKTLEDGGMSSAGDGALTAAGAGGRVFCADDHAQTEAADIILIAGTINAPIQILSTDFSTNGSGVPDELAGASVFTTTSAKAIKFQGYAYTKGITYNSSDGGTAKLDFISAVNWWRFDTCNLITNATVAFGNTNQNTLVELCNTNISLLSVTTSARLQLNQSVSFVWNGGILTSPSLISLFTGGGNGRQVIVRNVDLSGLDSSLVNPAVNGVSTYLFERCKLNASVSVLSTAILSPAVVVKLHSCDSGNTTYNIDEEHYEGTIIDETSIVRTGGASDGTTPISLKMTTNANAVEFVQPLVSPPITAWTDSLTEKTFTIEIIHDSLTNLQDDEIWIELEYGGADAQGDIANDKLSSILDTPADQAVSTKPWTTTGLTNPNKQKLSATVAPLKVGPITARVYLAKPSTTVYVDQLIKES